MTVKAILDGKGTDVATIEPSADLASAIKLLAKRRMVRWSLSTPTSRSRASSPSGTSYANWLGAAQRHWSSRSDK